MKHYRIDCVGFNDTSTLVGHFVPSPSEREKRVSVLGFNDTSTLVGHFVSLPEKGRKEIVEMKRTGKKEEKE